MAPLKHLLLLSFASYAASTRVAAPGWSQNFLHRRDTAPQEDDVTYDDYEVPPDAFFNFVTRPDIGAPKWNIQVHRPEVQLAPGYWFVAPYNHLEQIDFPLWNGPHIYDQNGGLIWSGAPMFNHYNVFDFRTVIVHGEHKYASLIFPDDREGGGVIIDNSYNLYKAVNLLGDLPYTNMHDFTVVDDGLHALTLAQVFAESTIAESKLVGFDGQCRAGWEGFRELDVDTSEIIFDWSAEGHIGLDESTKIVGSFQEMCEHGWDILHLNSIDKFPDGDYLLSARHTDALYKISHKDGSIVWRLGGKKSNFLIEPEGVFTRQHHARVHSQNKTHIIISLFDNAIGNGDEEQLSYDISRGLVLSLELEEWIARLEQHYDHPHDTFTNSRGSLSFLPNGNAFVGFTYGSLLAEYTAEGELLMEAELRAGMAHTYRAYKLPWVGHPSASPDVVSHRNDFAHAGKGTTIYVSWNGATEVHTWNAYEVHSSSDKGRLIASAPRSGFETMLWYNGTANLVVAEAIGKNGEALRRSEAVKTIDVEHMPGASGDDKHRSWTVIFCSALVTFLIAVVAGMGLFFAIRSIRYPGRVRLRWLHFGTPKYAPVRHADDHDYEEFEARKRISNDKFGQWGGYG